MPLVNCEYVDCALCGSKSSKVIARGYDYEYWTAENEFSFVRCDVCGHVYLNPRPAIYEAHRIYPPNYYTHTGRHLKRTSRIIAFAKKVIIRRRLSFAADEMKKGIHLLDIGCGDCSLLLDLKSKYPTMRCTGVDLAFSEEQKRLCDEHGIILLEGPIERINLKNNEYDLVIMNQLIEHLWQPVEVLRKILSCLKPGGSLSVETVNLNGYDRKLFSRGWWGGYYYPRHMHLFSDDSLGKLLENIGFKVMRKKSLLAPVIWTFSLHALLCQVFEKRIRLFDKIISDRNPICLALFSCVDFIAIKLGIKTSNQKIVGRKAFGRGIEEKENAKG